MHEADGSCILEISGARRLIRPYGASRVLGAPSPVSLAAWHGCRMDTPGRTVSASVRRRVRPNQIYAVLDLGSNGNRRGLRIGHGHACAIHSHLHRVFMGGHVLLGTCSDNSVESGK